MSENRTSIQKKLVRFTMTITGISLLVACLGFAAYDFTMFKQVSASELKIMGNVIGENISAALYFQDKQGGQEILQALKSDPRVLAAAIYSQENLIFAEYKRDAGNKPNIPPAPEAPGEYSSGWQLALYQPIQFKGENIGTILVISDLKMFRERMVQYLVILVLVLLASILVAFFLSSRLQRRISQPILNLASTASRVSIRKDYSIRAEKESDDEIGLLIEQFNEMLHRVEGHEKEIQKAHDSLEEKVAQRTNELKKVNEELKEEIGRREQVQTELLASKELAEKANKAKSEFLSRMSHELRTPMNAILGFAQIQEMKASQSGDEQDLANINHILTAGEHLLELIDEVLDIARIESGKMELTLKPVSLHLLVGEIDLLLNPMLTKFNVQYSNRVKRKPDIRVLADKTRLKQVLLNLLTNAIKYNREDGNVTLDFETGPGDSVKISISDTGPGIPIEDQERIFEPFNRLEAEYSNIEGTGIGLTISRRLVESMNGILTLTSEPGKGSCFYVELPLENKPACANGDSGKHSEKLLSNQEQK